MTAVYILLIVTGIIMLLSLIPINAVADFAYKSDNTLYVKFLFIKLKLYPPSEKTEEKNAKNPSENDNKAESALSKVKKLKRLYSAIKKDIYDVLGYVVTKAISVKELNISSKLGTGDPMYTGILFGSANAAVFGILGAADAKMKIRKFNVNIKPDFDNAVFSAGVYAVIYTRIIYLYYVAVKGLIILYKLKKTLKETEKSE